LHYSQFFVDSFVERLEKVATKYAEKEIAEASKVEIEKAAKLSALRAIRGCRRIDHMERVQCRHTTSTSKDSS
jgi:hypothetical protein